MHAQVTFGKLEVPLSVSTWESKDKATPRWGVHQTHDAITCTAPGRTTVSVHATPALTYRSDLSSAARVRLSLILGVTGASGPIQLDADLTRQERDSSQPSDHFADVGRWATPASQR